jgi:F420-0:gamma-glutamyl ligase
MIVNAVKTRRVEINSGNIFELLDDSIKQLSEGSIVAVTSKVVAICEGRTIPIEEVDKKELVINESDYYLPASLSKFDFSFTILHNTLIPLSGIDESNGDGHYILWPADPQKSANDIRTHLRKKHNLKQIGVIITDSTARPLHYGTEGVAISYSGLSPLNNYLGQKDLFGREFKVSIANILDGLASAAVLVMGEGTEQTPMAVISYVPFVKFQDHNPTIAELKKFYLEHMEDDLFAPFLQKMDWKKGKRKNT